MSISSAFRFVLAFAVVFLSAAPVAARDIGNDGTTPLASTRIEAVDPGAGLLAQLVVATCFAEYTGDNTTDFSSADATAVRQALAAVAANGTVKVAGYCPGVALQNGSTQVALITKTTTLAGGYTATNWTTYNPAGNPTTLDALGGGRVISASVAATLRGFTVTGGYISNTVYVNGGGIHAAGALTLSDMIVSENTVTDAASPSYGGGAYVDGTANVANSSFRNNSANERGGGLYAVLSLAMTGTQFMSNTSAFAGGGAAATGPMTLTSGVFQNNSAGNQGGGLWGYSTLVLTGTQFLGNTAGAYGGGAVSYRAMTLNGGLFLNNVAGALGGGVYAPTLALTGTQFIGNSATAGAGGGAFSTLDMTLNGGLFQGNTALTGAGLQTNSAIVLTGTRFMSNTASGGAGGGAAVFGAATLNGGLFQNNSAAGNTGGGVFAVSSLTLTGTQFLDNRADKGGGLYLFAASAHRVVNALFARNAATANGAAIYVNDAAPLSLVHATLVGPTAPTGAAEAIYVFAGTVYLTNTLIATHTIGIAQAGGTVGDRNTLFAGVATPYIGTVTSVGGITGAAGFANPGSDDYHLGAGSAAVNAGIDAGVYTDFEGQARPFGAGFDIGYDEYFFGPRAYLPSVVR